MPQPSLNRYAEALGRPITYVDVPFDQWRDQVVRTHNLSDHVSEHFLTMAHLHAANRYDRLTHNVEALIGRPATSIRDFMAQHKEVFDKQVAAARGHGGLAEADQQRAP